MDDRRARTEPTADQRAAAATMWQMYVALTTEGFTSQQALTILGSLLAASTQGPTDG